MPKVTVTPAFSRSMLLVIPLAVSAGVLAAPVAATPPEGEIVRTDLAQGSTRAPVSIVTHGEDTTLTVQNIRLMPHADSGWHSHPGPEFTAVTEGTVQVQRADGCMPGAVGNGQAVFIPAGVAHRVFNPGPGEAAAVATYTVPVGLALRMDAPAPCP